MSYYTDQDKDFVERTKALIEQYRIQSQDQSDSYETTLLLNCCIGLLIVPQQITSLGKRPFIRKLPETEVNEHDWGISVSDITLMVTLRGASEKKSIRNIARHMRNSMSHYNFKALSTNGVIDRIEFKDSARTSGNLTFEMTISTDKLRMFLDKLSDWFLDKMK